MERTRPQIKDKRNDNTTNPTRATAFHVIAPDDAASHQENAPRAPAETLCADFNRRGDYRLRDDRRLWRLRKKKGFVINYIRFTIPKIGQREILYTFEGYRSHYMTYEKDVFPTLEAAQEECKRRNEWRK